MDNADRAQEQMEREWDRLGLDRKRMNHRGTTYFKTWTCRHGLSTCIDCQRLDDWLRGERERER